MPLSDESPRRLRMKAFFAIAIFTAGWIFLVVPALIANAWFVGQPPPVQYVLYNLGFIVLFVGIASITFGRPELGIVGFLDFSFILDNLQPPFAYAPDGTQTIKDSGQSLNGASVDRVLGWLATDVLHLSGPPVFVFVYIVVPILAVALTIFVIRRGRQGDAMGLAG
jgi:hypothetical protein